MNECLKKSSDDGVLDFTDMSPENTRRLNSIAREIAKDYTEFVDNCCRKYGDNYLFWATPFASRNIFNDSDTFLSLCRIILTLELVKENRISKVITEFCSEQSTLKRCLDNSVFITASEDNTVRHTVQGYLKNVAGYLRVLRSEIQYRIHSANCGMNPALLDTVIILPVLSSGFDKDHYNDRYFTGVTDYRNVVFIPVLNNNTAISSKEFIKRISICSNYRFFLYYRYLRISDYCSLFRYRRMIDQIKNDTFIFRSIDISPLIKKCFVLGKNNAPALKGILMGKAIQRMAQKGIEVNRFCLWYEGRPSEVMIASSIRYYYSESGCVGYEGYPIEEINLGASVSDYQYQTGHAPKTMAIPGKMYEDIALRFCKDIRIRQVPILRSDYKIITEKKEKKEHLSLLVIFPIFPEIARSMLDMVIKCIDENRITEVFVKNHPVYEDYTFEDYGFTGLDSKYRIVHGSLSECLKKADIAMASETTSTLEVLFAGVQLIILYSNGKLGFTSVPKRLEETSCSIVYGEHDLYDVLHGGLGNNRPDPAILNEMIVEKNKESVSRLFL